MDAISGHPFPESTAADLSPPPAKDLQTAPSKEFLQRPDFGTFPYRLALDGYGFSSRSNGIGFSCPAVVDVGWYVVVVIILFHIFLRKYDEIFFALELERYSEDLTV